MASKLKNLRITKVDFVDEGANPDADIVLLKRKDSEGVEKSGAMTFTEEMGVRYAEKIADDMWNLCYALNSSLCSILWDEELDAAQKQAAMQTSVEEFAATTKEAVASWAYGKPVGLIAKADGGDMEGRLAERVAGELAKSMKKALFNMRKSTTGEEPESTETEGEGTNMRIDKSKMTDAERAALEDFEKRYGVEDGAPADESAAVEPQSAGTEGAPSEAGVTKSAGTAAQAQEPEKKPAEGSDDIYKGLNPAVRQELEELKKFREGVEDERLRQVAEGYAILGRRTDDLFPVLKRLKASDEGAYNDMIATLDSAKAAIENSDVFKEVGRRGDGTVTKGGAIREVEEKATALMKSKDGAGLNMAQAIDRILQADPDLAERYETEEE